MLPVKCLHIPLMLFFHLREQLMGIFDFVLQLNPIHRQTLQAE